MFLCLLCPGRRSVREDQEQPESFGVLLQRRCLQERYIIRHIASFTINCYPNVSAVMIFFSKNLCYIQVNTKLDVCWLYIVGCRRTEGVSDIKFLLLVSCSGGTGSPCLPCRGGETGGGLGRLPRPAETDGRCHQPLHWSRVCRVGEGWRERSEEIKIRTDGEGERWHREKKTIQQRWPRP